MKRENAAPKSPKHITRPFFTRRAELRDSYNGHILLAPPKYFGISQLDASNIKSSIHDRITTGAESNQRNETTEIQRPQRERKPTKKKNRRKDTRNAKTKMRSNKML